ncbi:MAG TPA: hypothetical protein PLN54_10380 [Flavobacteriales bacterium]|nr:hypothetical protein [Flavobacteriales bacterium]
MLNTVYIIVDGLPDERHICAVFSSRQAAEAALCLADAGGAIEEVAVDAPLLATPAGKSLWIVTKHVRYSAIRTSALRFPVEEHVRQYDDEYEVDVWAADAQEAVRLGAERIKRFMAGNGK